MSAFMLSKNHFNALTTAFMYLGDCYATAPYSGAGEVGYSSKVMLNWGDTRNNFVYANGTPSELVFVLAKANYDSLVARYGEKCEPEPVREDYQFTPYTPFLPASAGCYTLEQLGAIAKAVDCFEYQACEVKNWEGSPACRIVRAIQGAILERIPGYNGAEWAL